jgi:hypothetical protein
MKKKEGQRARAKEQSTQQTTEALTLEQRAKAIIADVRRYDIDTRHQVLFALKNFTFDRDGGGGYFPAEEMPTRVAEAERELRRVVTQAEAGERVTESGAGEEYDAAARAVVELLGNSAVPDFFRNGITDLLNLFAADTGARLWHETTEDDSETGGYSTDILARTFANHRLHSLEIERKKDLADLISAVLKHPDTPVEVHNALAESLDRLKHDHRATEYVRHVLTVASKETEAAGSAS